MTYMGSKARFAKDIVPILQKIINDNDINLYIEPFVGGANIIDKIKCDSKIGYDKNISLIELHRKGQEAPQEIPEVGDAEWWYKAKDIYKDNLGRVDCQNEMEPWRIGAIEFFASYSNGGFSRGYGKPTAARDYYNEAYRNFMKQIESPLYKSITFIPRDYITIGPTEFKNALIYCDPPYQNCKPYGYSFETKFDYDFYWNWIRELSKNNFVICSEQNFPEDFSIIWEKKTKYTVNKTNDYKATEKLGVYSKGLLSS